MVYREFLNTIADALKAKRPTIHASPFLVTVFSKIDWFISNLFRQKRKLGREAAKSSYSKNQYSNEKIKNILKTDFLDIKTYIQEISNL